MAIFTPSNRMLAQLHQGGPNLATDTVEAVLMQSGFTFNRDTHSVYTDISASELANGNGYTTGGQALTGVNVTNIEDDTNDRSDITWNDIQWTAVGTIGPAAGAILIDQTAGDIVIGYHDFQGDVSATDDTLTLRNPLSRVS